MRGKVQSVGVLSQRETGQSLGSDRGAESRPLRRRALEKCVPNSGAWGSGKRPRSFPGRGVSKHRGTMLQPDAD